MEKEGSALADRPRLIAAGELLSKEMRFVHLRRGERLRRYRKAAHTHLQIKAVRAYQDMQLENAKNVIIDILNDPKNHRAHATRCAHMRLPFLLKRVSTDAPLPRFAASVILRMVYGKSTPTSNDDPEVVRIHQVMQFSVRSGRPGAYLVDRFPFLKYVPGYGRQLERHHKSELELFRGQIDRVQSEMVIVNPSRDTWL